jgi:error-prone DNA polymerase
MVPGKLQKEGEVIHVIVQRCYNMSKLLRQLTPAKQENLPLLTLAFPDEQSLPAGINKRSQVREQVDENLFPEGRNFK